MKVARSETGERALIIMAKAPRAGHVKTRLAGRLLDEAIVNLYRCMIEDTLDLARSVSADALAIVCPASDVNDLSDWLPTIEIVGQRGEGLAAGLVSAFRTFIDRGYRRVVAIDGDSPQMPAEIITNAFELLESADLVIGPTADGGYFLVGSAVAQADLFDMRQIGTCSALDSLILSAQRLGLRFRLTETLYDVDEAEDLARLARELGSFPHRAPRTAAWLASHPEIQEW